MYRILIFTMFLVPLLLMLIVYSRIFVIVKQRNNKQSDEICVSGEKIYLRKNANLENIADSDITDTFRRSNKRRKVNKSISNRRSKHCLLQNSTKALVTTLMILGTYLLCYMPALTFLALTCVDGCPFPLFRISFKHRILVSFVCNFLVILKAIVDPLIYTLRMKDIKTAFKSFCLKRNNSRRVKLNSTVTRVTSGSQRSNKTGYAATRI
ncbi:hypothetical protein B4U80_10220 [Leptotrombidium deliense]|uniref:G-protein coupled receptors family 1 profile domain-containing protein n=1 Tax=Leptotrombidium deliense TaxID=299467 RepID=A0A443SHN3_9ACAR|nr:hypothetical protein B4U80_10220 [Leptotrombidium deliense]